ncbi:zinc transporter ZIP2 isoform X2 [Cephus cinctus]|uniref:Zinc transporter ZIP2 isoform X2 n=1 Tax=Cephus cinctus TaxID=211228 RepID=A0AAJ7BMN5_CEPCN|nr:zinc transporter ZIP2 isoform X2 [Cephus cinctus]
MEGAQDKWTPADTSSGTSTTTIIFVKIGAMIVLGCGSLALGTLPLMVGRYKMRRECKISRNSSSSSSPSTNGSSSSQGLLTSLLLCFGGGVLLFTTFIHLAPEVRESVERHQSEGQLADLGSISLAELLFCGGFFLVYLIEEVVHAALDKKNEPSESVLYRTLSLRKCKNGVSASTTTTSTTSGAGGEDSLESLDGVTKMGSSIPAIFTLSSDICEGPGACTKKSTNSLNPSERMSRETDVVIPSSTKAPSTNDNASVHGLLAVLALSFHAIFEGLTVGLEPSISSVIYLATAIATHKLVIAFCVGMELYVAGATTRNILGYLTAFSMVTPLGIIIGLALAYLKNDSEYLGPTPTILQGMAAGTLLYVVFFEVLAREKANEKSGLLQLAAIIVGFMVMLGIQLATSHSHAHGGGGNQRSEHNHGRDDDNHNHEQENGQYKNTLDDAIYRLTEKMTEVVSSTIASTISDVHS